MFPAIRAIVFDLDGTLYVADALAEEIRNSAARYIASLMGIDNGAAMAVIDNTQRKLSAATGRQTPLTAACTELGGDIRQLHEHFASDVMPEVFLKRNDMVVELLRLISLNYELYIYTNNNRALCGRILHCLGLSDFFRRIFTIEDTWWPKPDMMALEKIFREIGRLPGECLFVGDRYDVDLRLPGTLGSRVGLVQGEAELVSLLRTLVECNLEMKLKGE